MSEAHTLTTSWKETKEQPIISEGVHPLNEVYGARQFHAKRYKLRDRIFIVSPATLSPSRIAPQQKGDILEIQSHNNPLTGEVGIGSFDVNGPTGLVPR